MKRKLLLILLLPLLACKEEIPQTRNYIDLSGTWAFALGTADVGLDENWFLTTFSDSVQLPGTTDSNQKGFKNQDTTTMHLSRVYKYEGVAWYKKTIQVPETCKDKALKLHFERSKPSQVWIDSTLVGSSILLQSPQEFDVTSILTPGEHTLTVRVDNSLELTPYGHVHIYSDDTQTNWNGILGGLYIEAAPQSHIINLQVYPKVDKKKIDIMMELELADDVKKLNIELVVKEISAGQTSTLPSKSLQIEAASNLALSYEFENEINLWDEYDQPLYELTAIISNGTEKDALTVPFGMRTFEVKDKQFAINGRKTFLRGKHEAGVFPIIGHVPMDVESWVRVYEIAKSYGINHYRFHSYCPPEAAFIAADQVGIYLQAELPFWGGLDSDTVASALREEGYTLLKAYANHPSFVMFSHGNEIWSGHDRAETNIAALKAFDPRPLYTFGSNNSIGYQPPSESSDFFVAARNPVNGDSTLGHTRLTHAFADATEGATLNRYAPSTTINFDYAIDHVEVPLVSHEIGQYQIYPDYKEIDKYTGVLKAWNFEVFKDRLEKAGMLDQDSIFQKASGAWSALCYKAEMEAAFRTKEMAGFQLLDLQDFPGQGTALVGILDAFMDDKGVVSQEDWLASCNDVVILAEFEKYVWTSAETFSAKIEVANYSNKSFENGFQWSLIDRAGNIIQLGELEQSKIELGGLQSLGTVDLDLSSIKTPEQLTLKLSIAESPYSNQYPIWFYPAQEETSIPDEILITNELKQNVESQLKAGAKVLLFPKAADIEDKSVAGHFPPEFWNYGMFKGISEWVKKPVSPGTLGLLMDPEHPIFAQFPTDFHSNWQWFSIIKASRSLFLDATDANYRPIVQVIDNLERNHKMGMIFEMKVGEGKLLVCTADLRALSDQPEAQQLYQSIVSYMVSDDFAPSYEIDVKQLKELL